MQKPVCVHLNGAPIVVDGAAAAGKGAAVAKAAQKKVTVKPKPETVIEISPDTEEDEVKKEKPVNRKKVGEVSSRKKVQTLTSVLTARSKVIFLYILSIFF